MAEVHNSTRFYMTFGCSFITAIIMFISFSSPYWIQTYDGTGNKFISAGLWEFCFDHYIHHQDYLQFVYTGCKWCYHEDYWKIREFLMPRITAILTQDKMASDWRKNLFLLSFILTVLSVILNLIAISTGHWKYSIDPPDLNPFRRCGLWEFCFVNFENPDDLLSKAYSGCHWVYSPEYWWLTEFMMPSWFIACQWLSVVVLVFLLLSLIFQSAYFMRCCSQYLETATLWMSAGTMLFCALVEAIVVIVFGAKSEDRTWMPRPDHNYLSWSYGLAVISGFFALFSGTFLVLCAKASDRQREKDPHAMPMGAMGGRM